MFSRATSGAGRSAETYFREAQAAWRCRIRLRLLLALGSLLVLTVPIALLFPRFADLAAAFWVGSVLTMGAMAWESPPEYISRWKRGAEGEQRTAKELHRLRREGWYFLHDLARSRSNRDHVAIGPGGVFPLDSKNVSGVASVEGGVLTVRRPDAPRDDYACATLASWMTRSAVELKEEIEARTGLRVWVQPVVVIWDDFPERRMEADGVSFISGAEITAWLRERPQRLSERTRELVCASFSSDVAPRQSA